MLITDGVYQDRQYQRQYYVRTSQTPVACYAPNWAYVLSDRQGTGLDLPPRYPRSPYTPCQAEKAQALARL
jgi:hypothetical protein